MTILPPLFLLFEVIREYMYSKVFQTKVRQPPLILNNDYYLSQLAFASRDGVSYPPNGPQCKPSQRQCYILLNAATIGRKTKRAHCLTWYIGTKTGLCTSLTSDTPKHQFTTAAIAVTLRAV